MSRASGVSWVNRLRDRLECPARAASQGSSTLDGPARTHEGTDFGLVLSVARRKGHVPFIIDDLITNISYLRKGLKTVIIAICAICGLTRDIVSYTEISEIQSNDSPSVLVYIWYGGTAWEGLQ